MVDCGVYLVSTAYQPYSQKLTVGLPFVSLFALFFALAMARPPALPALGGNATAAVVVAGATRPEEMVTHPGAATAEGDMNYLEEDFDPMTGRDPRRDMPGAADAYIHYDQLSTINFTNVAQRTANVALVQQGLDPALAAQQQTIQSEANALHSEVLERHRESLVSEGRDHLTRVEKTAAEEITQRNLLLNKQTAHAMSEQKPAQLHLQFQDHRIKELRAELNQCRTSAGLMSASVDRSNAD